MKSYGIRHRGILFLFDGPYLNTLFYSRLASMRRLEEKGHRTFVAMPMTGILSRKGEFPRPLEPLRSKGCFLPTPKGHDPLQYFFYLFRVLHFILKHRIDIMWLEGTSFMRLALPCLTAKFFMKRRLVVHWADLHGNEGLPTFSGLIVRRFMSWMLTFFENLLVSKADEVTCNPGLVGRAIRLRRSENGVFDNRMVADTKNIFPVDKEMARMVLGLPKDRFYLGFMGGAGFWPEHQDHLLRICTFLVERKIPFRLLLIGDIDGSALERVDKLARELGIVEFIATTGWLEVERLRLYLASCDVLLLPVSGWVVDWMRLGRLVTYMAAGRPVVATGVGAVGKVIARNRCGLLSKLHDPIDMAEKVAQVLSDSTLGEELGLNGRRASEEFSFENQHKILEQILRRHTDPFGSY